MKTRNLRTILFVLLLVGLLLPLMGARAGSNAAVSTTYVTLLDGSVDGNCGAFRVRNVGSVDVLLQITFGNSFVVSDFPLPITESELFHGRTQPITKVEVKVASGTGSVTYGIVER